MVRSTVCTVFILSQIVVLLAAGVATLWWSQSLMFWLIHMVGEERALGSGNVIRLENGAKLLTNPSAMVRWMAPFWFLGVAQITAAVTLVWLSRNRHQNTVGCVESAKTHPV